MIKSLQSYPGHFAGHVDCEYMLRSSTTKCELAVRRLLVQHLITKAYTDLSLQVELTCFCNVLKRLKKLFL